MMTGEVVQRRCFLVKYLSARFPCTLPTVARLTNRRGKQVSLWQMVKLCADNAMDLFSPHGARSLTGVTVGNQRLELSQRYWRIRQLPCALRLLAARL